MSSISLEDGGLSPAVVATVAAAAAAAARRQRRRKVLIKKRKEAAETHRKKRCSDLWEQHCQAHKRHCPDSTKSNVTPLCPFGSIQSEHNRTFTEEDLNLFPSLLGNEAAVGDSRDGKLRSGSQIPREDSDVQDDEGLETDDDQDACTVTSSASSDSSPFGDSLQGQDDDLTPVFQYLPCAVTGSVMPKESIPSVYEHSAGASSSNHVVSHVLRF
jgi:hypothetical protein